MSITLLPNGRLRVQVYDQNTGRNVSVAKVLGLEESTFPNTRDGRRAAVRAREDARLVVAEPKRNVLTVRDWYERWTRDKLFETGPKGPRKDSTLLHYHGMCRPFVQAHGDIPLSAVDGELVAEWLAGGRRSGQVGALRVMFNDAKSRKAGRLIVDNPWSELGISKGSRKDVPPPSEGEVWEMIRTARKLTSPDFAAWLQFACFTGMRPGELDGLERASCDVRSARVDVSQQWSARVRKLTLPKNNKTRVIAMPPPAVEALEGLYPQRWAFTTGRGTHFSPSSRSAPWDRVRTSMGWLEDESRTVLYTATRHFAGWYFYDVLGLDAEDVAFQLGHEDGGELVRTLYGHKDRKRALGRVDEAFANVGNVRPLRAVEAS